MNINNAYSVYSRLGHLFLEVSRKVTVGPGKTAIVRKVRSGEVASRGEGEVMGDVRDPSRRKPAQGNVILGTGNKAWGRAEKRKSNIAAEISNDG